MYICVYMYKVAADAQQGPMGLAVAELGIFFGNSELHSVRNVVSGISILPPES